MKYNPFRSDEKAGIVDGFDQTIYDAFVRSLETSNNQVRQQLIAFVQKHIYEAIEKNANAVFQTYIVLPTYFYRASIPNTEASNNVVENFANYFRGISNIFRIDRAIKDEQKEMFYQFFGGLISFYRSILFHSNEEYLLEAFKEFNYSKGQKQYDYETRQAIIARVTNNPQTDGKEIREQANERNLYSITQRRAALGLLSWIIYLYDLGKMDQKRFGILVSSIEVQYTFFEDLLEDVIFIRENGSHGYMGFDNWDHTKRESGKMYHPPMVSNWIIYGLTYILLKEPNIHYKLEAILDNKDLSLLYDTVKKNIDFFKLDFGKWSEIFGFYSGADESEEESVQKNKSTFEEKERQILGIFQDLKVYHDSKNNQVFVGQSLDEKRVLEFKNELYKAWHRQCSVFDLFAHFGNKDVVTLSDNLKFYGSKLLLKGFKIMFVENQFQKIYGSADLGANVGRKTDGTFVDLVLGKVRNSKSENIEIIQGIDSGIGQLIQRGFTPTLIIIPPEFIYRTRLREHQDYRSSVDSDAIGGIIPFGLYNNIPVITFFSRNLSNQVIVTDFAKAFKLEIYENSELFGNQLYLNIRDLTLEEIEKEFKRNTNEWKVDENGFDLSDKEAKMRLSTSVYLDIWSRGKMEIIEPEGIEIFTCEATEY